MSFQFLQIQNTVHSLIVENEFWVSWSRGHIKDLDNKYGHIVNFMILYLKKSQDKYVKQKKTYNVYLREMQSH